MNVELLVYGHVELMLTKYCLLNHCLNKNKSCSVCRDGKYYLVDRNDKRYRIINDADRHLTHIMNYQPIDKLDRISYYLSLGINNFRIELLDEDYEKTNKIIKLLKENREEVV